MFAPSYLANAVALVAMLLAVFNIHIAPADLQTTVTVVIAIVVPVFTMFRQWYTGRSTVLGSRPK